MAYYTLEKRSGGQFSSSSQFFNAGDAWRAALSDAQRSHSFDLGFMHALAAFNVEGSHTLYSALPDPAVTYTVRAR